MKHLSRVAGIIFASWLSPLWAADGELVLRELKGFYPLGPQAAYVMDPLETLDLTHLRGESLDWQPGTRESLNFDFVEGSVWLRFRFSNRLDGEQPVVPSVYLNLNSANVNEAEMFHFADGVLIQQQLTGTWHPFDTRMVNYREIAFRLALKGEAHEVFIRLKNRGGVAVTPVLSGAVDWFLRVSRTQLLLGATLGMLVIMMLYNLVVFGIVRERVLGLFAMALLFAVMYRITVFGFGAQYLWPDAPQLNDPVLRVGAGFSMTMLVLATVPLLATLSSAYASFRRLPGARPFLFAWLVYCASLVLLLLRMQGVMPFSVTTEFISQLGMVVLAVISSLALARRLSEEKVAKVLAEQTASAKALFLTNMSHEIRTPMNAIRGFSELTLKTYLDTEQRRYLEKIQGASDQLLGIINDVLDFSKIEAGKLRLDEEPLSIAKLMSDMQAMFEHSAKEQGVALNLLVAPDVPDLLCGDALRLSQVLTNLISNALKFTPAGAVTVEVQVRQLQDREVELLVSVKDTGIGIEADKLHDLFESTTQADVSTTRQYGGTGLGLAISQHLVQLMGGRIWLDSEPGRGSTFSFTVRLQLPDDREAEAAETPVSGGVSGFGGLTVLVVEDNQTNQMLASAMLRKLGVRVALAGNGAQALDLLAEMRVDAVLMDCQMPVMDGFEATRKIGQQSSLRDLPVIAMTANAMQRDREACLAAGMSDYVAKPISMDELSRVLSPYARRVA